MTTWMVPATVVSVYDGDTIHMELDLGWHVTLTSRCRVTGINSPEMDTDAGVAARDYAQTLLTPGDVVTFTSKKLDPYGRPLGLITLADGRDFGKLMLEAGQAVPYR